uniref:RRM domain-containing protein n=1 Tax=Graphocephala atropunctata TaxID=36148 RepID=A0A1B6KV82_9HEMI
MRAAEEDNNRIVYCGNLSDEVTDEILYELFHQAGPVERVLRPKDQNRRPKSFAFITYKHDCSVPYALELFKWTKLFNRNLNLNSRSTLYHVPVLDTHLSEFSEPTIPINYGSDGFQDSNSVNHQEEGRMSHWNGERGHRSEGKHRRDEYNSRERTNRRSRSKERNVPKSWAELNALKGRGSLPNGHHRNDLESTYKRESSSNSEQSVMPDYNTLLQMSQQMMPRGMMPPGMMPPGMMHPGMMMGLPGMLNMAPMMGLGPSLGGNNMFPSMQGKMNGGEQSFTDRNRERRDQRDGRGSARDHPYNERRYSDYRDDNRRHDRGYSSSRSSHDREKRDRRSR